MRSPEGNSLKDSVSFSHIMDRYLPKDIDDFFDTFNSYLIQFLEAEDMASAVSTLLSCLALFSPFGFSLFSPILAFYLFYIGSHPSCEHLNASFVSPFLFFVSFPFVCACKKKQSDYIFESHARNR